jgi:hypothetical protein
MFKLCRWLTAIGLACSLFLPANAHSEVLYRFSGAVLFDGKYGPVARAQQAASTALVACGKSPISADGRFGSGTRAALRTLAGCPAFQAKLAGDADARDGTLTDRYWTALITDAAPSVDARAKTIMLTFEATDYTRMEWNFCQSSPLYNPAIGNRVCYSNDPRSYLTWGPNGATGGGGREVQLILKAVDVENASIVEESV